MENINLTTPIEEIPGIGNFYQKKLKRLGIRTVEDLISHFPHRYEDFSRIVPIAKVKLFETICVSGKIKDIENKKTPKRKMIVTEALVEDETGTIRVVWFNQPYLIRVLKKGDIISLGGKVMTGAEGLYFSNPSYEKISTKEREFLLHTGRLVAVYPETEGLSSRWLRNIIFRVLKKLKGRIEDFIPEEIRKEYNLLEREKAFWQIHFPRSEKIAEQAKKRFSFEELFLLEAVVLRERIKLFTQSAFKISINLQLIKSFLKTLPFQLTGAQKKCLWQILKDMEKGRPMNRLLEGDVGSGKTIVAAVAALNVIKAGYQVALMAPTEILAKQHFKEISKLLMGFKVNIGLLTGKEDKFVSERLPNQVIEISREKLLLKAQKAEIDFLIGTHTLIQGKVKFGKLALVILDEQHRFGIEQRARLVKASKNKEKNIPHLLSMTATPIPRTLSLTIYGDLDLSLLDELPKGRKKVITKLVPPSERKKAYGFIRKEVEKGRQVFVICPRIEPTKDEEKKNLLIEMKAVKEEYEKLSREIFPKFRVAMLHGKMTPKEKERIMADFKKGKIDILVSTSVVEVGIDVPKATVMIIEGAERFGLAQLHQFRGRVGRSELQAYCFLFTESSSRKTMRRLKALISAKSGFELAERDLEIRGPGDLLGKRQWGIASLSMEALKNLPLVETTREVVKKILKEDPLLENYPLLKEKLSSFKEDIHLE